MNYSSMILEQKGFMTSIQMDLSHLQLAKELLVSHKVCKLINNSGSKLKLSESSRGKRKTCKEYCIQIMNTDITD